jgi:ATP-dependent RNA/DNA helicase IGHMBP2
VAFALSTVDVALIHGPPGTGKTTAVAELIKRFVERDERVLVCAPSNIAVDNLAEKLAPALGKRMVRIGHPARVLQNIVGLTLDSRVSHSEEADIIRDMRRDIAQLRQEMRHAEDRRSARAELSELNRDLRAREAKALSGILASSAVVLATLTGAGDPVLDSLPAFDVVVIDEAAQALEAACWIALLRSKKCILAGDDKQLGPTIKSDEAARQGLAVTLFERLRAKHGH